MAPIKALEPMSKASRATPSPNDTVIRVYDAAGNVIETHEHKGDCNQKSTIYNSFSGVLAQLVERLNGIEEVTGSNPVGSTSLFCAPPQLSLSSVISC